MSDNEHQPVRVAIADGTQEAVICSSCGVVRGGWVEAGSWPCAEARCDCCDHAGDVHYQDGCRNKSGGGYFCECLAFEDGVLL